MGRALLFWGPSIVAAEGEQWRKYRKIATPAFNNETYTFVWEASQKIYADMVSAERWSSKDVIEVPSMQALTFKFTLVIFASVGFGLPFTWSNSPARQGDMAVRECFETIVRTNIFAIIAPAWAWKLPFEWVRRTRHVYDTMRAFMQSQVSARREDMRSEGKKKAARDIFSLLVQASENKGATLGFLALNVGLQDEIVAQVQEVTRESDNGILPLEDYGKLDKVLAAFYEGTRLFPSGVFLIREAKQDTILDVSDGEESRTLPVKKGTHVQGAPKQKVLNTNPEKLRGQDPRIELNTIPYSTILNA
ncbi:cytochrome P450 [Melanogaster broomeanus]|nr:cytochrome P450 [Melanogaster broomeanus]